MSTVILGLDIGGANLKAAHTNDSARTIPFALWKHPERLGAELAQLCAAMPAHECLAVTMTGELCDCFDSKRDGVRKILLAARSAAPRLPIRVWTTHSRFLDLEEAMDEPHRVAAANWLALACYVGLLFPNETVLLIDTGSTTTDIVAVNRGTPAPHGLTDPDRLASGELVYTGMRRTPICAVLGMEVAAEFFATMLDAYLFLRLVAENTHDCDTADGRPATRAFAHARLARMCCADVETFPKEEARAFAEYAVRTQWETVERAIARATAQRPEVDRVVLSGSGAILGKNVCARSPRWVTTPLSCLADSLGPDLSDAACAYAVAMLAAQEKNRV